MKRSTHARAMFGASGCVLSATKLFSLALLISCRVLKWCSSPGLWPTAFQGQEVILILHYCLHDKWVATNLRQFNEALPQISGFRYAWMCKCLCVLFLCILGPRGVAVAPRHQLWCKIATQIDQTQVSRFQKIEQETRAHSWWNSDNHWIRNFGLSALFVC